jgi:CRP-like cAMP-binding protein
MPDTRAEFELQFSLDFSVPPARAQRILTASVMAVVGDGILEDPEPKARIKGLSNQGVEYKVKYWIDAARVGPGKARHRVLESVLEEFRQSGIAPAQPKQDIFYSPMPNRQLDTRSDEDRAELLSRIELFAGLDHDQLGTLAMDLTQQVYSKGTQVIKQGDPGDSMFIVIEGLLHVQIDFGNGHSATRVGHIRPGEFFGEMSLLTGEPRTASVVAATDTLTYQISKADMDSIFLARPQLADSMSRLVAKRRLANDDAYAKASAPEKAEHEATLARQIADKIHHFFGAVFEMGAHANA